MTANLRKCAECGAAVTTSDGFLLDVNSPGQESLDVIFCGQDHAAHWLTRPLPQAVPDAPFTGSDLAMLLAFLTLFALAVIGVIALFSGVDVNPF